MRAGCRLPWTRPPYGYRLDPDRPRDPAGVTLEPAEAAVVRELFAAYLEDHAGLFGLAKRLRALGIASPNGRPGWSPATLRGLLTNPTYTGQAYAGRWRSRAPRLRRSATHPIGRPSDSSVPVPAAEWLPVASVPALVSETGVVDRSTSTAPRSVSSCLIARLSGGWVMCSRAAARPKFRSSATATK